MTALLPAALLAAATGLLPVRAAPPPEACHNPVPARPPVREQPWAQRTLDAAVVRPHSTGAGVVVAVVDPGVDTDHPQLRGGRRGADFHLVGDLPGTFDCASHGTAVAGLIAARPVPGVGFAGLAPGATVLPVRVAEREEPLDPVVLARAVWYAADQGADVINLSIAGGQDDRYVRDAVAHARAQDAVIVAAAGNQQRDGRRLPSFPASYDGVLGIGAVDQAGRPAARQLPGRPVRGRGGTGRWRAGPDPGRGAPVLGGDQLRRRVRVGHRGAGPAGLAPAPPLRYAPAIVRSSAVNSSKCRSMRSTYAASALVMPAPRRAPSSVRNAAAELRNALRASAESSVAPATPRPMSNAYAVCQPLKSAERNFTCPAS